MILSSMVEVVGRFTWVQEKLNLQKRTTQQYTAGVSHYFYKHFTKIQADLSYTEEPILANHLRARIGMEVHF